MFDQGIKCTSENVLLITVLVTIGSFIPFADKFEDGGWSSLCLEFVISVKKLSNKEPIGCFAHNLL